MGAPHAHLMTLGSALHLVKDDPPPCPPRSLHLTTFTHARVREGPRSVVVSSEEVERLYSSRLFFGIYLYSSTWKVGDFYFFQGTFSEKMFV